jgi:hypothetical protein
MLLKIDDQFFDSSQALRGDIHYFLVSFFFFLAIALFLEDVCEGKWQRQFAFCHSGPPPQACTLINNH